MAKQAENAQVTLRDVTEEDLPFMNEIFNYNIVHTTALFFTSPVTDEYRLKWFRNLKDPNTDGGVYPCLLGVRKDETGREVKLGYISYLPWLEGVRFHHVAEISLYISQNYTRSGLAIIFLNAILAHPLAQRFKVIVAGITAENLPSVKFFSRHGFVLSGRLHNVGFKFDRWLDAVFYTLNLPTGAPTTAQSDREISLGDPPRSKTELSGVVCRDVCEDDLDSFGECRVHPTLNCFELATATTEHQRAWLRSLSGRPVVLAQDQETKSPVGHAYLWPISERPAYRFTMELHLAVSDLSAIEGLVDAVLGHQLTKAFRLIVVGVIPENTGFEETLLARGFRQTGVINQGFKEGETLKDMLLYELDLETRVAT